MPHAVTAKIKPVLSALGILNALGHDKPSVLDQLLSGYAPGMQRQLGWLSGCECLVGSVRQALPALPPALASLDCRNNRLLFAALKQIEQDITAAIAVYGRDRIGVVIGSSTSGILEGESALRKKKQSGYWPEDYHYRQQEIGSPAECVARLLDLPGIAYTVSTACSSSAKALGSARQLIEMGLCDAVICGGADSLCRLTLNGFQALEALSHSRCDPFAEKRNGITIGEGAAVFLMERDGTRLQSNTIYFSGIGESSDAHHISAPQPQGLGAEKAMRAALSDASITASNIHYINLHGTATPLNDSMESDAVFRVFSDNTPCSSTKPLTGHTLGAAGATEAGLCWLLLSSFNHQRLLPAQINSGLPDNNLQPIKLLHNSTILPDVHTQRMLSNSFAFGGSNTAVILETSSRKTTQ
jgi:3-oxoacyl-[acyl-carrier-protein] synthase-1